jgi:hypothetical protein
MGFLLYLGAVSIEVALGGKPLPYLVGKCK